ncbi:unnamed protein product [Rotaria sp. Silwood1]|nr:unnamed protein product [Rotaria sp. Silwood1]CAF4860900.1 unnamed protein product [Rotaria sp. Silwood1]
MSRLQQFKFHIRSILRHAPHIEVDTIRQSFNKEQQSVDCVLDYFKNGYGQCQIYSLPFIGTRLDFISNRFPLFDVKNTFSNVTTLLLFDDAALILHNIYVDYAKQLLCRSCLPCLVKLIIYNDSLSAVIADNNQQARENCSKVASLQIIEPWIEPTSDQLNFFPSVINL